MTGVRAVICDGLVDLIELKEPIAMELPQLRAPASTAELATSIRQCHTGMMHGAMHLAKKWGACLLQLLDEGYTIECTGHSMYAATPD